MRHETIADLLLARTGDGHAGLRTRERTWTWDEVVRASAARAALARELRIDGPFHIGVLLDNVPEYVFWLGAAALSGATIVGVNSTRRGSDLEQEVRHTDLQLVVTDEAGLKSLDGLDIGVPRDRFLLVDGEQYAETVAAHACEPFRDPEITAGTQMLLLFTSGTTGASKAARCSQGRLTGLGYANHEKYDIQRHDITYCCMPLFHGNALMALWAPSLAAGATVTLVPRFSASGFLPDVRFYGVTFFTYVGKAIAYVLATPEAPGDADNTLTHGFGTEASPEDRAGFLRRFGCRLFEGYGSSEGAGMIKRAPEGPAGALGRPAHGGGYIYFAGRSGDWIRVDGENVSALLTERVLRRHPRIVAAAIFGVPDPRSGDQVMAAIEVSHGTSFEDLRLAEFLAGQEDLGTKAAPHFVRISHALPATGSGKLRKKEMRHEGWRTGDRVYRWAGRGGPGYTLLTDEDKAALRAEFAAGGRQRFLP